MVALLLVLGGTGVILVFGVLVVLSGGSEPSPGILVAAGVLVMLGAIGVGLARREARHRRIREEFHRTHPGWPWGEGP